MDRVVAVVDPEHEIEQLMAEQGIGRAEAITIVALRHGEVFGEGDLVSIRPLTEEERARTGVSRSLREALAAQRNRRGHEQAPSTSPKAEHESAARRLAKPRNR